MSRSKRLLDLIQILRGHRFPVTGANLAQQLGISLRTLYRDIATLQEQGANIEGESGLGYVLRSGYMLPPLMFSEEEIEALVLGLSWVIERSGDTQLEAASRNTRAKIAAVLPENIRRILDETTLLIGPQYTPFVSDMLPEQIRQAIRGERKIDICYCDLNGNSSIRTVWPFAQGYFEQIRILMAWCEVRQGFRHFRADRITSLNILDKRYPRRRQELLKEWRELETARWPKPITTDRN